MKKYQEERLTKKRLRGHESVVMMVLVGGAEMNCLFVCSVTEMKRKKDGSWNLG